MYNIQITKIPEDNILIGPRFSLGNNIISVFALVENDKPNNIF